MKSSIGRRLIMIKTQIVKADDKPLAVIMDYQEYRRLKEIEEDREDYYSALEVKTRNKKWKPHGGVKKRTGAISKIDPDACKMPMFMT
jgi:hypothetical protein